MKRNEPCFSAGINPTRITNIGRTAVGLACWKGYPRILSLLLSSCSNSSGYGTTNATYGDGVSEAKKGRKHEATLVEELTPDGMDGLQWEDELSQNPNTCKIHVAPDEKEDEWSILYRYYASVIEKTGEMLANTICMREPHCLDAFRQAPIHYAVTTGNLECMQLLLYNKAPVDMTTNTGHTALHLAVQQPKMVSLLLKHKADPNRLTFNEHMTPMHLAAKVGNAEVVSSG